ncbi:hypothetical protein QBC47DRAFT_412517 [Echria macrotheca]|uniref:Ubiquitin-like domain-containing protein n=1 Tax=Echria macrotheca TaxID=438768 RepID=A0AAJ0FBB4_9PEZI|nr:hypothetical protein QBC47DRAFT_412517 [Echria macrotheca]
MSLIEERLNRPSDTFYLQFAGKKLEEDRDLSAYTIQRESVIWMVNRRASARGAYNLGWSTDERLQAGGLRMMGRVFQRQQTRGRAKDVPTTGPRDPRKRLKEVCDASAEALIIEFYQYENTTYKPACFPSMQTIISRGVEFSIPTDRGAPQFRWIHLPANNPAWAEIVLADLLGLRDAENEMHRLKTLIPPNDRKSIAEHELEGLEAGVQAKRESLALLLQPVSGASRHPVKEELPGLIRFVRPSYSRVSSQKESVDPFFTPREDERVNSYLFMPFIEQETSNSHEERKEVLNEMANPGAKENPPSPSNSKWTRLSHKAQLLLAYGFDGSQIHERRTLDQAFYYTMPTAKVWERDTTQVVSRFSTLPREKARLLMVDQLWMWVIQTPRKRIDGSQYNIKTIVTAFPAEGKDPNTGDGKATGQPAAAPTGSRDKKEAFEIINIAKMIPDVRGRILSALYGNYSQPVVTPADLICLIIDKCAGIFHPTPQEALYSESNYLEPFVVGIGKCASMQTELAEKLSLHSRALQKHLEDKNRHLHRSFAELLSGNGETRNLGDLDAKIDQEIHILSDITEETDGLEKIKDIMDELNSISYFFAQQIGVVQTMAEDASLQHRMHGRFGTGSVVPQTAESPKGDTGTEPDTTSRSASSSKMKPADHIIEDSFQDMEMRYTQLMKTLTRRREEIGHLKSEALRVYKDFCDILDLKQKQATVSQALSARQESKEAEKQGQTLLLFTIITIIFLPLSFIAAIFSMNATEITGDNVNRPISQIFSIMIPSTAGVLIISLLLAYTSSLKYSAAAILRLARLAWPSSHRGASARIRPARAIRLGAFSPTDGLGEDRGSPAIVSRRSTVTSEDVYVLA